MNTGTDLYQYIIHVCFWAGVVMLAVGIFIVIAPDLVIRIGSKLNSWISTDAFFDSLDAPRSSERLFYRHHVISGTLLVLGAGYIFYVFVFGYDAGRQAIDLFASPGANEWLTASLEFLNILFSVLVFLIGMVVIFRPSSLKKLEARANRWFLTDRQMKGLDVQLQLADNYFTGRPRLLGLLLIIGSSYILANLWTMM